MFCGDGLPNFYVNYSNFPEPLDKPCPLDNQTGLPSWEDCAKFFWPDYQFTQAGAAGYQALYSNINGVRDAWINYWKVIVNKFKNSTYLLGYELLNEPFAGNIYDNPLLMVPGVADLLNLQPAYGNVSAGIRQLDDLHIIFFEAVTWDDLGNGFQEVPGGSEYVNRSALSYHYYEPPNLDVNTTFTSRMEDMKRLGCAGMLTEFNTGDDSNTTLPQVFEVTHTAEENLQSWIGWAYKVFNSYGLGYSLYFPNGSIDYVLIKALARTYPKAVAGNVIKSIFDNSTAIYTLIFTINQTCKLPTELFVSEDLWYVNGYEIQITPNNYATWSSPVKNQVLITLSPNAVGTLTVVVSPK